MFWLVGTVVTDLIDSVKLEGDWNYHSGGTNIADMRITLLGEVHIFDHCGIKVVILRNMICESI